MECQGVLMTLICEMWARRKQQAAQFSLHEWKEIFGAAELEALGLLLKLEQDRVLFLKIENTIITVNFPDWQKIAIDPDALRETEG